jgi:hypothetical protein
MGLEGEADVLEVILAASAGSRFANLLDRGQKHADENGDDRDYDQQLDQREATPAR